MLMYGKGFQISICQWIPQKNLKIGPMVRGAAECRKNCKGAPLGSFFFGGGGFFFWGGLFFFFVIFSSFVS